MEIQKYVAYINVDFDWLHTVASSIDDDRILVSDLPISLLKIATTRTGL